MPRSTLGLFAVLVLALPSQAQTVRYWPELEISFPVPQAVMNLSPRPAKLRLYSAPPNGRFELFKELSIDNLQPIKNRSPGFIYTARGDGEEEFAVQKVYADGTVEPSIDKLKSEFRIIFDTKPPAINLQPLGANGVQWSVTDENLDTTSIRLECRWAGTDAKWFEVKSRSYSSRDDYTWANLNNRALEVRLSAKDKAGHESVSRIIKLPDTGGGRAVDAAPISTSPSPSNRTLDDIPNAQAQIVYVNRRDLTIRSKLTHITRSGISKVHLYVKDLTAGSGGEWKFDSAKTVDIHFDSPDTTVDMPFVAPKDGRYGFIVIPESGVNRREPDPRPSAPPQHLVEVDTVNPNVKIRTVTVSPGGTIGPRVEIEWDADDRNLMPDPIVLEYAKDKTAKEWLSIAEKIPNSRRYVWEVSDKTMFKLYIRARATDKAGNVGEHIYEQAVIIDLDKPSATIDNIRGSGSASPQTNERPSGLSPALGNPIALPNVAPDLLRPGK